MKVHFFEDDPLQTRTACGVQAWRANGDMLSGEADTVQGFKIEVTANEKRVTCKKCAARLLATSGGSNS